MKIPFLSFDATNELIRSEMIDAFTKVFDSKWYIMGDYLRKFEEEYAHFNQVSACVGVSNGLDALFLSLKVLGIGQGDEVLIPSNTYIASALAVSYTGAKPVFVEPNEDTFNINPLNIEAALTPATKAIMPVHLYGQCCEMQQIMAIADKHKLWVIEDNAQSQGSQSHGKIAGSFGHVNGTSFYPGKNLGAIGDAGAVTTNDPAIAEKVKVMRNYGSQKKYYNEMIGYNMRLDELQAGLLSVKLNHLEKWTRERQQIAKWYDEALAGIGDLRLPGIAQGSTHVYHLYVIRTSRRNQLQEFLAAQNIGTLIHYPVPMYLQEAYAHLNFKKGDFPIAEKMSETVLSLPLWPGMTEEHVQYVAKTIAKFF